MEQNRKFEGIHIRSHEENWQVGRYHGNEKYLITDYHQYKCND